jgi:hypothetical protein
MRLTPRTVCLARSLAFLVLACLLLSASAAAQQRGRPPRSAPSQNKNSERAKLAQALTLLSETADKARLFDDLFYRARVQAIAADALWPHDERQARAIFRRAWEAAKESDKDEQETAARETGALPGAGAKVTEARDEVLRRVAAHDSRLVGDFLREMTGEGDEASVDKNEPPRGSAWGNVSASGARRLALAHELLDAGETRLAVEIASPVINEGVSADLMTFILHLRAKSIGMGDTLYLQLIEHAAAKPETNANTILLLSSGSVSHNLLTVVDEFGSLQFRSLPSYEVNSGAPWDVTFRAVTAFYNLAASILLRPQATGNDPLTMQELVATFYAIGRLLPFFEQTSASFSAYAPALHARYSELFNMMEANRRDQVSSQLSVFSLTPAGYVDPLRSENDQLARASDAVERERIALLIIKTAVRSEFWDRARRAASEIEDLDKRRDALTFIQVHQIKSITQDYRDEKEDDFESITKFVRGADVPPFAKAWGFAQAAVVAARKRDAQTSQKVVEIINEAEGYAEQVGQGTLERVAAYGVVVMTAARFDKERAWSLLREYVKSANAVEDFTGDETSIDLAASESMGDEAEHFTVEAEVFRLDGIFATMAHLDFDKALTEARALDGDVPQALATIAVAKSRMQKEKQNPEVRIQKPE